MQNHKAIFRANRPQAKSMAGVVLPIVGGGFDTEGFILKSAHIHEAHGQAADVFASIIAAQIDGPLVWIGRASQIASLTPLALKTFFDPVRLVTVSCQSRKDILWASEQALRCGGASCVILELRTGPNLFESRRLQLAAEASGALGLVLIGRVAQSSAAQTRWHCEPLVQPLEHQTEPHPSASSWRWHLQKNKSGPLGSWSVSWKPHTDTGGIHGQTDHVHMVAATPA